LSGFRESVRLGEHNLDTLEDCDDYCLDPVQDYEIAMTIPHEKFNSELKNDIGLVRLKTKVPQYTGIPACLFIFTIKINILLW
jgi:hypothetical protein